MRWAIWGTGSVSASFAAGLADVPGARITAVASRVPDRAARFIAAHAPEAVPVEAADVRAAAASLADKADIAYVATPTGCHAETGIACLEAGLHLLVEKPMAAHAAEAEAMVAAARRARRLLMEGLWTRFLPAVRALPDALAALGEVRLITGGFAMPNSLSPGSPRLQAGMGGGALRFYGIYPLALGQMIAGPAADILASGRRLGEVDGTVSLSLRYASGAIGHYYCSMETAGDNGLVVHAEHGRVALAGPLYRPTGLRHVAGLSPAGGGRLAALRNSALGHRLVQWRQHRAGLPGRRQAHAYAGNGYGAQAAEAQRCIGAGLLESPLMPHADSLELARLIDAATERLAA